MSGYPEPIHLLGLSEWLSGALNVSLPLAELFATLFIAGFFLLICMVLKSHILVTITIGVLILMPLTAIGWCPVYVWVVVAMYLALRVARSSQGVFT